MSLIHKIENFDINKIFPNRDVKLKYLTTLANTQNVNLDNIKTNKSIDDTIINTWNYSASKEIIRDIFLQTEKYINSKKAKQEVVRLMSEWQALELGEFDWPFSATNFDNYVHKLNRSGISEEKKDNIIAKESIRFRRIKDINAFRNDYIEYLIFENNKNVIPTLKNSGGVDFYINGYPYDQKVGKSVGKVFIEKYGENYKQIALSNPELVAKSLYENQDSARFGYEPRLLIVYLDSNLTIEDIEKSLKSIDFDNPITISFEYVHSRTERKIYNTDCFVVLLHK